MAARLKIPESIMQEVWDKYSVDNWSSRKIADWLMAEKNISIKHSSVCGLLNKLKKDRKEIAQSVYANAVAETANKDVYILGDMINKIYSSFNELLVSKEHKTAKLYADTLIKYIAQRINLSGLNEEVNKSDDQIKNELLSKLEEIEDKE